MLQAGLESIDWRKKQFCVKSIEEFEQREERYRLICPDNRLFERFLAKRKYM